MPVPVLWWIIAACVCVVLPAALAFVGDEEPDNAIVHEQQDQPPKDPDADLAVAA